MQELCKKNNAVILIDTLKFLCCNNIAHKEDEIKILKHLSKNRILIKTKNGGIHKVKFSSLRRTTGKDKTYFDDLF